MRVNSSLRGWLRRDAGRRRGADQQPDADGSHRPSQSPSVGGPPRLLGARDWRVTTGSPRLRIVDDPREHLQLEVEGGDRAVILQGCDTCDYLFGIQHPGCMPGSALAPESIGERLRGDERLIDDDDMLGAVATVIPEGSYTVIETVIRPERVVTGSANDYFAVEGPDLFGVHRYMNDDDVWVDTPPGRPGVPLWRERGATPVPVLERPGEQHAMVGAGLFHFLHPLVSPAASDEERVAWYAGRMAEGPLPCALGLSFLDVRTPAVGGGPGLLPWNEHWLLATYLLDGHHKVEAAARTGSPLRLLTFVKAYRGNDSTLLATLSAP
jgi:hypothetical protein